MRIYGSLTDGDMLYCADISVRYVKTALMQLAVKFLKVCVIFGVSL